MIWSAWYYKRDRFDSDWIDWNDLPDEGLQVVIVYTETGRTIYDGGDWYWLYDGHMGMTPSGEWDTWQPKPSIPCQSCIKMGTALPDEEFQAIHSLALAYNK